MRSQFGLKPAVLGLAKIAPRPHYGYRKEEHREVVVLAVGVSTNIPMPPDPYPDMSIEQAFNELVGEWNMETGFHSSPELRFYHPLYLQIIGMGKDIIPLLLREVKNISGSWFIALRAITRQDPVTQKESGSVKTMCEAWLKWGKENGYEV